MNNPQIEAKNLTVLEDQLNYEALAVMESLQIFAMMRPQNTRPTSTSCSII